MATQEHKSPQRRDDDPADEAPEPIAPGGAAAQKQDEDTDGVLDEIDEVLESNAEEFVRGFVQKGGE